MAECGYLPSSDRQDRFATLRTKMAYRVWRRKLRRYAGLGRQSPFKLLDVGCGPGYLLRSMEGWFPHSERYGLDREPQLLDFAGRHLVGAQLVQGTAESLPFGENAFDVVCSLHVLEHLVHPEILLDEVRRVLRPAGLFLAATPNPEGIAARVLKDQWPGRRDDHISLKTPCTWREMITAGGLEILEEGTTGLSGFRLFCRTPLALLNWLPLAAFGYFPWRHGESYMVIARKR